VEELDVSSLVSFAHSFANFAVKKREFNRKDAKKRKVCKVQFHAVYGIATLCAALYSNQWENAWEKNHQTWMIPSFVKREKRVFFVPVYVILCR